MSLEAWNYFRRQERCEPSRPLCWHCGADCSGDTTESVEIERQTGEVPVCDPTEDGATGCE